MQDEEKTKISFQLVNQCTRLWCKFTYDKEDICGPVFEIRSTDLTWKTKRLNCALLRIDIIFRAIKVEKKVRSPVMLGLVIETE